jgi:hypothetical protein
MWAKVRQLTGRSKSDSHIGLNPAITADALNNRYAATSLDTNYTAPQIKFTVNDWHAPYHFTHRWMFKVLRHPATNCNGA